MTFPFKVTVVGFQDVFIESEQQYLEFLNTPQSLTSFAESNIEMQNMSNILNVDIHVFTYSATAWYSAVYKPMYEISQFSEWAFPTNDGLNTVVLYHEENIHFETIVSRSEAIVAVPKHFTLRKRKLFHIFEDLPELPDVFEKSFDEIELSVDKPVNNQNVPPNPFKFQSIIKKRGRPKLGRDGAPINNKKPKKKKNMTDFIDNNLTVHKSVSIQKIQPKNEGDHPRQIVILAIE